GGDTVINFDPAVSGSKREGIVKLKANVPVSLTVGFEEKDLEAVCILRWRSKSQQSEVVPATAFGNGLQAFYSCEQPKVCYTVNGNVLYAIALQFPEEQLWLDVGELATLPTVTLLGCEKVLPCHREGKWLVVDTRSLKFSDLSSTAAWTFKINN
ncbi:MAG: hypothetical protein MJZ49_07210, partial [Bacteroidales bacterium]|nr:hypothetical protein [Bacteroidales bacterium]